MRPTGSPEVLENRRQIAARLFERGMTLTEVAAAVGASVSSAHRWKKAWRHGGKLVQNLIRDENGSFRLTSDPNSLPH